LRAIIQLGQAVVDIRQLEIFTDGIVHLAAGNELVDQPGARHHVHGCQLDDAPQHLGRLCRLAANTVGLCHSAEFGDGFLGMVLSHEQVADQSMQGR
jgi:hypothetical protein